MTLLIKILFLLFTTTTLLSGCSSQPKEVSKQLLNQDITQRNQQLTALIDWQISGKIAFIQDKKRESASIQWHYQESKQKQRLDLTTYLGINVLHLQSNHNIHTIKVDGSEHQGTNLDELIFSLTGLILPTEALTYWLKGLPYQTTDQFTYSKQTQLPTTLTSRYNHDIWQISYDNYQVINKYRLATKFTIRQNNLLIKIAIKQWTL